MGPRTGPAYPADSRARAFTHITVKIKCCISPATRAALTDITLIFYVSHLSGSNRAEAVVDRSMCDDAETSLKVVPGDKDCFKAPGAPPSIRRKTRRSLSSPMRLETALLDIPPCAVLFLQVIGDNQRLFDGRVGSQIPGEIEPLAQLWRD